MAKYCERCGSEPEGYSLHDYCAICSRDLCKKCAEIGCCGNVPMVSGSDSDFDTEEPDTNDDGARCADCGLPPGTPGISAKGTYCNEPIRCGNSEATAL